MTVGPVTKHPFGIIQEGAFFVFEGIRTILRGVVSVIRGVLTVLAGLFVSVALWSVTLCIKLIIFIFKIAPTSKSLQRINQLLSLLVNAISSSRPEEALCPTSAKKPCPGTLKSPELSFGHT